MRRGAMAALFLVLGACGDDGGEAQDTRQDSAADVADTGGATEVAPETTPAAVTWDDVYPIFAANCTPCHGGAAPGSGPSGGHSIASPDKAVAYQASQLPAAIAKCAGKTVGECALIRIQDGSMPATGACQDPTTAACPDGGEQALIQQWIDGGMQEN